MKQSRNIPQRIGYLLFCLTGVLFLFCWQTAGVLERQGNIVWTGAYTAKVLAVSLAGGAALGGGVSALFWWLDSHPRGRKRAESPLWKQEPWKVFCGSLVLILLAWLPAYLAYYPAVCAYDMPVQTGQIAENYYVDHHPIAHTFLLKCFMKLGEGLGSITAGVGLLALLQLLFLGAVFAYGVCLLCKNGVCGPGILLVQLWCMFYPFHWYMGVSITKDTIFTGFFVLLLLLLYELLENPAELSGRRRTAKEIGFGLATVGMILFRNNGLYALLVLLFILLLAFLAGKTQRRFWGRLLCRTAGAFLVGSLLLSAVFKLSGAEQGDKREMLSLPIQQLARTMLYHGGVGILPEDDNSIGEEDKALINDFILNQGYGSYNPRISDPVKRNTNTYVVRYRTKEFLETYLGLFFKYPGDYLNAGLAVNAGYLYPNDTSHAYINVTDDRIGRGYVQTYWEEDTMNARGIYKASKWTWLRERLESWADENAYLRLPVIKYLFVPGVWFWLYFLLLARLVMRRSLRRCVPLALVFGYFITLFLGPAVQLRYLYPVMAAFPFALLLGSGRKTEESAVHEGI